MGAKQYHQERGSSETTRNTSLKYSAQDGWILKNCKHAKCQALFYTRNYHRPTCYNCDPDLRKQ